MPDSHYLTATTQHLNTHCLVKHHSDRNVHIYIYYANTDKKNNKNIRYESTMVLLEGKLITTTESISNRQFLMTSKHRSLVAWETVKLALT